MGTLSPPIYHEDRMSQTDTIEKSKVDVKLPKQWAVVIHNDDVTPMDFVIELLNYVFNLSLEDATKLTFRIHTEGKGVAGVYPYEIAEQKKAEAQTLIRIADMVLDLSLEEE